MEPTYVYRYDISVELFSPWQALSCLRTQSRSDGVRTHAGTSQQVNGRTLYQLSYHFSWITHLLSFCWVTVYTPSSSINMLFTSFAGTMQVIIRYVPHTLLFHITCNHKKYSNKLKSLAHVYHSQTITRRIPSRHLLLQKLQTETHLASKKNDTKCVTMLLDPLR